MVPNYYASISTIATIRKKFQIQLKQDQSLHVSENDTGCLDRHMNTNKEQVNRTLLVQSDQRTEANC